MKQQRFVDAFEGNATEAARVAGYSTPKQAASRLLKNVDLRRLVDEKTARLAKPIVEKYDLSFEQIIEKFAKLARDSKDDNVVMKAMDYINKMRAVYIQKHEDVTNYKGMSDEEVTEAVIEDLLTDESARSKLFKAMADRGFVVSGG